MLLGHRKLMFRKKKGRENLVRFNKNGEILCSDANEITSSAPAEQEKTE
jgi:hypothetical protein